jgi:hypothetical protein
VFAYKSPLNEEGRPEAALETLRRKEGRCC